MRVPRGGIRARGAHQREYLQHIRSHDLTFGIGPAGTGKTYLAVACAVEALQAERVRRIVLVRPAVEAGERLGFLPGDLAQKVDPYLRPDVRRTLRDDGLRPRRALHRAQRHRGGAARLHARPLAQRLLHHPRRGAEHHHRADEDVPDAHRLRLARGGHRRCHADRSAARHACRACSTWWTDPARRSRASPSPSSTPATWCAIRWCSASCRRTSRARARESSACTTERARRAVRRCG